MGVMTVVVRRVTPGEYLLAGQVTRSGYEADGLLIRDDGSYDERYAGRLIDVATRDAEAEVFVAVEAGTLLGTVTWCPPGSPWRELAVGVDQAEFRMLSVAPAGRGRGAGRALVAACLERAHDQGAHEILLSSLAEMEAAHRLYARFGFVRAAELDHSPVPGTRLWAFRLEVLH